MINHNQIILPTLFKELLEYCHISYTKANLTQDVTVSVESVSLLGREAFPRFVQESPTMSGIDAQAKVAPKMTKAELRAKLQEEADKAQGVGQLLRRVGYEGQFRIRLQGEFDPVTKRQGPTILNLIREVVTYGKGLNGMAYRDVIETLQAYAVTRVSALFRRNKRHWRYRAARILWRAKFREIKLSFLRAWYVYVKHVFDTKTCCFRKVVGWHFYTRRAILRREHFKIAFWPFYVWHRWAAARRTATEKTQFLVFRVLPCYIMLRHFRAFKRFYLKEKRDRDEADLLVLRWRNRRGVVLLAWYRRWTRRRKRIRLAWYRSGMASHRSKIQLCKVTPFLTWKSYWYYKRQMHARIKALSFQFCCALLPDRAPLRPATCLERRDACKAASKAEAAAAEAAAKAETDKAVVQDDDVEEDDEGRGGKGKRGPSKGKRSSSQEDEEEDSRPRTKAIFRWKMHRPPVYDVPSDGEDEIRCARVNTCYSELSLPLPKASDLDFLGGADDFIMRKVGVLARRFLVVDKLALVETSMRYHRYMHRCFINLRTHAHVSRASRNKTKRTNHKRKMQSFLCLVTWMLRDANGGINFSDQTPAEEIFYAAKDHRMEKMMKWRDMGMTLKQIGRETATPGEKFREKKYQKVETAPKDLKNPDGTPFDVPNFLEWDRADRQIETEQAECMVIVSRDVRLKVIAITETAQVESQIYDATEVMLNRTVDEVLVSEDNITQAAVEAEMIYISAFKRHAADNLLNVLVKVQREVELLLLKEETKKYFRMLRMPMLEKRGLVLYNYKKMTNWLRICHRLAGISRNAPRYHQVRTMWVFYNRWLKLVEKESLDATPGLVLTLTRRKYLFPRLSRLLQQAGFKRLPYSSSKRLYNTCSTLRSIFCRWLQEAMEEKNFRLMEKRAADLFKWRLLHKCFYCMRTAMSPEDTYDLRHKDKPYMLVRIEADLGQISKRFVAPRRRSLPYCITLLNKKTVTYQKREARRTPSMKSFIDSYRQQVGRQLVREQRILLDSFEARGTQHFHDVPAPDGSDPSIMPGLMARVSGPRFYDPQPELSEVDRLNMEAQKEEDDEVNGVLSQAEETLPTLPTLPGGFKIHKVRINHSVDMGQPGAIQGIVGWQLVWCADGCKDIEGPKRGRWKGASMKTYELVVPRDEFVMAIEYAYQGVSILGVRLRQMHAGWSRWLGDRPGVSTLTLCLEPELSPRLDFEKKYASPGRDEDESPAMPRAFIVGFSGVETQGRLTGLTMVVRKIKEQHIFSYFWVGDALAAKAARDEAALAEKFRLQYAKKRADTEALGIAAADADDHLPPPSISTHPSHVLHPSSSSRHLSHQSGGGQVHLPSITGGSVREQKVYLDDDSASVGSRSVGDLSSISHASPTHRAGPGAGAAGGRGDDDASGQTSLGPRTLTSSEEQFFDVFRMRLMEIKTAEDRAERFARKLWSARQIRDHPVLQKLSNINIIAPLTRWYFASICKRVVRALPTEARGEELLEESKKDTREADRLHRRSVNEYLKLQEFEEQPQAWAEVKFLSPVERAQKKAYLDQVRALKHQANTTKLRSLALHEEAACKAEEGHNLLPRMCLSTYICTLYNTKLAAARHKETLLLSMDREAIKRALCGGDAKLAELTDVAMEMIRFSLSGRKPPHHDPLALDRLVEAEVKRARANLDSAGTSATGSGTGMRLLLGSSASVGSMRSCMSLHSQPGSASQRIVLPNVVTTSQNDAAEVVPGYASALSSTHHATVRKRSGIDTQMHFAMQKNVGASQRRAALLKSKSLSKL